MLIDCSSETQHEALIWGSFGKFDGMQSTDRSVTLLEAGLGFAMRLACYETEDSACVTGLLDG